MLTTARAKATAALRCGAELYCEMTFSALTLLRREA